jgi:hypothetical protein
MFENRVLRRIFGPKRDEVTGKWRKQYNEERKLLIMYELYFTSNIVRVIKSRRMRWTVHVARLGERRDVFRFLVRKPEGKRPHRRPSCRWEDNIKMDIQEVGCGGMDWTNVALDKDRWLARVNAVMNLRVP